MKKIDTRTLKQEVQEQNHGTSKGQLFLQVAGRLI
jgi:hypothetical protein